MIGARPGPAFAAPDRLNRASQRPAASAGAPESPRTHHQRGRRQFDERQYEAAIASYRRAYELKADPSYLLDIAEAYRALEMPERALFFYQRYLSAHPNPPNRPEVEAEVARLQPLVTTPASPSAPPALPATDHRPFPAGGGPGQIGRGRDGRERSELELGLSAGGPQTLVEEKRPILGRWWFWTAIGALAAAGATVAILSASRGEEEIPPSQLGNAKLF